MMGSWLFSACPTTVSSVPAQRLGEYVQNFLRPADDCQRQIDAAVDTICAALQEAKELPTVTDVAKVSQGWGWGFWEPGYPLVNKRQSDLVLSTYCVPGPGCTLCHLVILPSGERMRCGVEFRSTGSGTGSAPSCV